MDFGAADQRAGDASTAQPPAWEPPSWDLPASDDSFIPRRTFALAIATVTAWSAFGAIQLMIAYLLRRRTNAWRTVIDGSANQINVSAAQLADENVKTAINLSWVLVVVMFVVGGLWVHGAATNGQRRGVHDVQPVRAGAQFAIPILGVGYALRELTRIMATLRFAVHRLGQWSTAMFVFLFIWLGCYLLERAAWAGTGLSPAAIDFLELQSTLAWVRAVPIVVITGLAARAILHTDRVLRSPRAEAPPVEPLPPMPAI